MIVMKKLILMGMMVVGMTSFATMTDNENRLEEFRNDVQTNQKIEMISSERTKDLNVSDTREFFETKLNNYEG